MADLLCFESHQVSDGSRLRDQGVKQEKNNQDICNITQSKSWELCNVTTKRPFNSHGTTIESEPGYGEFRVSWQVDPHPGARATGLLQTTMDTGSNRRDTRAKPVELKTTRMSLLVAGKVAGSGIVEVDRSAFQPLPAYEAPPTH
ncbi:uncharacterized protein BO87DRAFT_138660 [Aspergillus neoniger CBS 115656]|uniref:Uncharacterized protein n=1 Tax=Aspergillus neoniger (strain CBS 115656) TaxID=1448310 RepID=A0A318Y9R8_ASPNB|nr:hypothetical protein BO87DRAFT_138660 [Aspergillus neoniger CBS 115656]PYH31071.1 hypothetical protein BO87DRAFT_138660 [Aspergillus neoniger CBS 115656]